ncbi:MAG TPA: hypothetical protein GX529_09150 [Firmicutes bacterium]|nr:hypothetical protein [Candidatus Fermentithermobacillaceae bacterium]
MKLRIAVFAVLSFVLCVSVAVSGCKPGSDSGTTGNGTEMPPAGTGNADVQTPPGFTSLKDFHDAWDGLMDSHEAAINRYESPDGYAVTSPRILLLVDVDLLSGTSYDALNPENLDGRFEGNLLLSGRPGHVEKDGTRITFGSDYIREKDGFAPSMKAGDRLVENGSCDLSGEVHQMETFTEREGQVIVRNYSEFKRLESGEMMCLRITGHSLNQVSEEDELSNTCTFMKVGKDRLEFVIAKATCGPGFEKLSLADKDDLSKDEARELMEAAGYEIEQAGGIADGVLFVD